MGGSFGPVSFHEDKDIVIRTILFSFVISHLGSSTFRNVIEIAHGHPPIVKVLGARCKINEMH